MQSFLKSLTKSTKTVSHDQLQGNLSYYSDENSIEITKKTLFTDDVLTELKTILTLISSPETLDVSNELIKKLIKKLIKLRTSKSDPNLSIIIFGNVFKAFVGTCKKEESKIVAEFFIFLCHVLGVDRLSSVDSENTYSVNETTFKCAFHVDSPEFSSDSLSVLEVLLKCLAEQSIGIDGPETQHCYKWFQGLVIGLGNVPNHEDTILNLLSLLMDTDMKLIENNLEQVFSKLLFHVQNNVESESFHSSYSEFLKKTLRSFTTYQRLLKFFTRFLTLIKTSFKEIPSKNIFPASVIQEFQNSLKIISPQQVLALLNVFISNFESFFSEFPKLEKDRSSENFLELMSTLTHSLLKEIKIYAPGVSYKTLELFIKELDNLRQVVNVFGDFVLEKTKLILKNGTVLKCYLELSFCWCEIHTLVHCYESKLLGDCERRMESFPSEHWSLLVKKYFREEFKESKPIFFQIGVQRIKVSKLERKGFEIEPETLNVIKNLFDSTVEAFSIVNHLEPENMALLMDSLPFEESDFLMSRLLKQIIEVECVDDVRKWSSESILLENRKFVTDLFTKMVDACNAAVSDLLSKKTSKFKLLSSQCLVQQTKGKKEVREIMVFLLTKSRKICKLLETWENGQSFWRRMSEVLRILPLMYMENNMKESSLVFALQLAVMSRSALALENVYRFLSVDIDISKCFDVGLFLKWLNRLTLNGDESNNIRKKVIKKTVKICSNSEDAMKELATMLADEENGLKILETQVVVYEELSQPANKTRKRKLKNENIESCRMKMAKVLTDKMTYFDDVPVNDENHQVVMKMMTIHLEDNVGENLAKIQIATKLQECFEFGVNKLMGEFDKASSYFLSKILEVVSQVRGLIPGNVVLKIWSALKRHQNGNWRLFAQNATDAEFDEILEDLTKVTKESFYEDSSADCSASYYQIWKCFIELESESRRNKSQIQLQNLFYFVHDCQRLVVALPPTKKKLLIEFFCNCLTSKKVVLTSHMIDTIVDAMVHCPCDEPNLTTEHFHGLFIKQIEAATFVLLKHFVWNRSKIHLNYVLFKGLLENLTRRSNVNLKPTTEDVFFLSACAFSLEKWIAHTNKERKDFARITPYFIAAIISCITAVTVLPAVKMHLVNCLNSLLQISDSHTVSYLLRVLKPGHQQVFTSVYNQFKKYHKYTGKV